MKDQCGCQAGFVPGPQNPKQINGCSPCSYITIEILPANLGDDNPNNIQWAPKKGRWEDKIVVYAANGAAYFYDHNGDYVQFSMGRAGVQSVNNMTGIVNLPNLTLTMGKKTLGKFNAGEPVIINLPIPELGQVAEEDTGYISGALAYQLQQNLQANIDTEIANREAAIATVTTNLTNTQGDLNDLQGNYTTLESSVATLEENLDQSVERDMTIFGDADTVTITKTIGNLKDNSTTYQDLPVPMASETSAGCITAEMYQKLLTLIS